MIKILEKLKNTFLDEEGKPKTVPLIILFVTIVILVVLITTLFSAEEIKKAAGSLNINYNLPEPPDETKVKLDNSNDISYLKRDELTVILDRELPSIISTQNEKILDTLTKGQRDLIMSMREERQEELAEIQGQLINKQQRFEEDINKEIQDIKAVISSIGSDKVSQERLEEIFSYLEENNEETTPKERKDNRETDIPAGDTNDNNNSNINENINGETYIPDNNYQNYDEMNMGQAVNRENNIDQNISVQPSIIIDGFTPQVGDPILISQVYEEEDPGFSVKKGIKAGSLISARLEVGLISSEGRSPALVLVTEEIQYEDKVYIPKGSYFLGYGTADYGVRQIFVTLEKLVIGDREIDVTAHLVKGDGTPGFQSEYIDLTMKKFWPSFLLNFSTGILNAFKDTTYIVSDTGLPQQYYENTVKNRLIDGTTEGATSWSDVLMQDARKYEAIITVDPGIECQVFLDEKIPIDRFE